MSKVTLCIVVLFLVLGGCGAKLELERTPIVVSAPSDFVLNTHVYTERPSLHFSLPMGADGTGPLYPQISIEQVDTTFHPETADAYADALRGTADVKFVLEPTNAKVGEQEATEMAIAISAVADVMDPMGIRGERFELVTHEVVFSYGEHYYVCRLVSYPDEYMSYLDAVRSLCRSVKFASER